MAVSRIGVSSVPACSSRKSGDRGCVCHYKPDDHHRKKPLNLKISRISKQNRSGISQISLKKRCGIINKAESKLTSRGDYGKSRAEELRLNLCVQLMHLITNEFWILSFSCSDL
eukprot:746617-Hanusia_phi.AAC.8